MSTELSFPYKAKPHALIGATLLAIILSLAMGFKLSQLGPFEYVLFVFITSLAALFSILTPIVLINQKRFNPHLTIQDGHLKIPKAFFKLSHHEIELSRIEGFDFQTMGGSVVLRMTLPEKVYSITSSMLPSEESWQQVLELLLPENIKSQLKVNAGLTKG